MDAKAGNPPVGVAARLSAHPERFSFHQAIRLARRLARARGGKVRCRTRGSLDHPTSDVSRVEFHGPDVEIVSDIIALAGATGILPGYWNDALATVEENDDSDDEEGLLGFLDLFHQRLLELRYETWEKTAFAVREEREDDAGLGRCLLALIGLATPGLDQAFDNGSNGMSTDGMRHVAAILNGAPRTADGFGDILAELLGVPVDITPLWGRWRPVPERLRWRLGAGESAPLGKGVILGRAVHSRSATINARVGPMGRQLAVALLEPRADGSPPPLRLALRKLADYALGGMVTVRAEILLRPELRPQPQLGTRTSDITPRLGHTAWLGAPKHNAPLKTVVWLL